MLKGGKKILSGKHVLKVYTIEMHVRKIGLKRFLQASNTYILQTASRDPNTLDHGRT